MNVLSCFDGVSCAYEALTKAGIKVNKYYAVEIDPHPRTVADRNHPDIIRPTNDVCEVVPSMFPDGIDLIIGGSPCQDMSIAKKGREGLAGARSGLFYTFANIIKTLKPKYFVLENVYSMSKECRDTITAEMGVEPVKFDAALVSAQSRKRLFWTNLKFELPEDANILLADILEAGGMVDDRMVNTKNKAYCLTATYNKACEKQSVARRERTMVKCRLMGHINGSTSQGNRFYSVDGKAPTISTSHPSQIGNVNDGVIKVRKLTVVECERLQSLPDNYTEGIPKTARYKCIGNAFNVSVVAHILKTILLLDPTHSLPSSPPPSSTSSAELPVDASPSSNDENTTEVKPKKNTQRKKSNRSPVSLDCKQT